MLFAFLLRCCYTNPTTITTITTITPPGPGAPRALLRPPPRAPPRPFAPACAPSERVLRTGAAPPGGRARSTPGGPSGAVGARRGAGAAERWLGAVRGSRGRGGGGSSSCSALRTDGRTVLLRNVNGVSCRCSLMSSRSDLSLATEAFNLNGDLFFVLCEEKGKSLH